MADYKTTDETRTLLGVDVLERIVDALTTASALGYPVYDSTAAGLSSTANGGGFSVRSGSDLVLYRDSAGSAVEVARLPLKAALEALDARTDALEAQAFAADPVYATTTAGLAATSSGQQFKVENVSADIAFDIYRNDSGTATRVSSAPSVEILSKSQATTPGVSLFPNLFDDLDFAKRGMSEYLIEYAGSTPTRSLDTGKVFEGVFGPSLCLTGVATTSTWMGAVRVTKYAIPAAFEAGDTVFAFFAKSSKAASFNIHGVSYSFAAGETKLIQIQKTITTATNYAFEIRQNPGTFAEGDKLWISPLIIYRGAVRTLRDMRGITPDEVRDKFMASAYKKQVGRPKNMFNDPLLVRRSEGDNGYTNVNANGSAVSVYDDTSVFPNIRRSVKTTVSDVSTGYEKARVYFHTFNGYVVKAGETMQIAFQIKCDVDMSLRIDIGATQHNLKFKAGEIRLMEFEAPHASDSGTSAYSVPFSTNDLGTFWVSPFIYYISKTRAPWLLNTVNHWEIQGDTRYNNKRVGFLGDSMSVNKPWQPPLINKYGFIDVGLRLDGYRDIALGGSTLLPIENQGTSGAGALQSIYKRAEDVKHYAPDYLFIFGGINDKGTIQPYPGGKIPIGTVDD
ncbi:SGNH/GDSL hydrolase family protein, partial [Citreimonas sp.]|uniref:SGNH/GDSL hydrolase family protein n=1 Tax=Citreimonas sp. TaxID=3036715 RepID=UPI0035C8178F